MNQKEPCLCHSQDSHQGIRKELLASSEMTAKWEADLICFGHHHPVDFFQWDNLFETAPRLHKSHTPLCHSENYKRKRLMFVWKKLPMEIKGFYNPAKN
jgi:hypothetical protein